MAGAAGVMTGFAFPEVLVKVVDAVSRRPASTRPPIVFYRFVPLMRFEFQEGIGMAIRKEVLRRRGALADGSTRAPGAVLDDEHARGARSRAAVDGEAEGGGMDLGLKGKVAMVAGASRGLGFAVARGLAAEGASVSIASRARAVDRGRRRSASPRRRAVRALATAVDVRAGRVDLADWHARTVARVRRRRFAVRQRRRAAGRHGAVVRRRGVDGRVRAARPERRPHGAPGGAVDEGARRRRHRRVDVVGREGADSEPRALERRAVVGLGAVEDAVERAGRRRHPRQPPDSRPHRHRSRAASSTRFAERPRARPPTTFARLIQRQFRSGDTGKPSEFASRGRISVFRRRAVHYRGVPAGRRRPDPERLVWSLVYWSCIRDAFRCPAVCR